MRHPNGAFGEKVASLLGPRSIAVLLVGALLATTLALAGCQPFKRHAVTVATNIWPGYEPGYIAELHGLYGNANIDMRQMQSASDLLRAFRNGSVDVVALTLDDAIKLQEDGYDIKVLMVVDISNGLDAIVARPPIASVAQLDGKAVAVENSALGAYVLQRALDLNGVPTSRVRQVAMSIDQSVQMYQSDKVDAVVTFSPYLAHIKRLGGKTIFDSSQIPGEIIDVLITTRQFAEANPEDLRDLLCGWSAAIQLIRADREARTVIPEIAGRLQISPTEVLAGYRLLKLVDQTESAPLLVPGGQVEQTARRLVPIISKIEHRPINPDIGRLLAADSVP